MKFLGLLAITLSAVLALPLAIPGEPQSHVNKLEARMAPGGNSGNQGNTFRNYDPHAGYANRLMDLQDGPSSYNRLAEEQRNTGAAPKYEDHAKDKPATEEDLTNSNAIEKAKGNQQGNNQGGSTQ